MRVTIRAACDSGGLAGWGCGRGPCGCRGQSARLPSFADAAYVDVDAVGRCFPDSVPFCDSVAILRNANLEEGYKR